MNADNAQEVQAEGRKVLGDLLHQLKLGGIKVGKLHRYLADGTLVIAQYDGTTPTITAIPPQQGELAPAVTVAPWVPQGFVVVPASSEAAGGWGIPAVPGADDPVPFLDPGPLPAKWTAAGALPQVLLTRVANAGYPSRFDSQLPIYFDAWEAPDETIMLPDEGVAWAAYRVRFRNLGASFHAVLDEINDRRDHAQPLSRPFYGYADMAVEYGNLIGAFGSDAGAYPIGSSSAFKRIEKDGTVTMTDSGTARGALGVGAIPPGSTVDDIVDALVAAQPDLTDGTLKAGASFSMVGAAQFFSALLDHNEQWVHCGNIDWVSIEPEIPRLSWMGPRGRCLPAYEMASGVFPIGLAGLSYVWTSYFPDQAIRVVDGRTEREFDRFIFARGRILACLPNLGYVLSAAIQKIPQQQGAAPIYRMLAIGWHRADQKTTELAAATLLPATPAPGWFDTTSDVRVWWSELPTKNGLACAPAEVVDGVYDATTNPQGWKGGTRVRMSAYAGLMHYPGNFLNADGLHDAASQGYTANELAAPKVYWQPWMFNGSGDEATCIRGDAFGGYGSGGVFYGAMMWPGQRLRMTAAGGFFPDVAVSSMWEVGGAQGTDVPNGDSFAPGFSDRQVAADYAGDDLRLALLVSAAADNMVLTSPDRVLEDFSGYATLRYQMGYLDIRTDLRATATYSNFAGGTADVGIALKVGNSVEASRSIGGVVYGVEWFETNGFNLTSTPTPVMTQAAFGCHSNPAYSASFTEGGYRFFDAPMAQRGEAFVGAFRFGSIDFASPFTVHRLAAAQAGTMDLDTLTGGDWLNFAGVT